MALSRTEIEILIKARSESEAAFQRQSEHFKRLIEGAGGASTGIQQYTTRVGAAGVASTAAGVAVGLLAERVGRGLVSQFQVAISAANKLDAGLIGLSSVARAFGGDADRAQEAARKLASDGLMSVGNAAAGLKNLLASGFSLDQAITLMDRFKDSAAFGRQGALDFGQAIVGATEGIKNGNSTLVDNAGVTKKLSQILVEAGLHATDLNKASSDLNVRMALFNGLLKETNPQLGDAQRLLGTAAGQQTVFAAQTEIAYQKLGQQLQPALLATLSVLTPFVKVAGELVPVLVPIGATIAAVVAPMVAMRAAAALGIPSLGSLRTQFGGLATDLLRQPAAWSTVTQSIQAYRTQNDALIPRVGLLQQAFMAFAAFEIGKGIGDVILKLDQFAKTSDTAGGSAMSFVMRVTGGSGMIAAIQGVAESASLALDGAVPLSEQIRVMGEASAKAERQIYSYQEALKVLHAEAGMGMDALERWRAKVAEITKPNEIKVPTMQDATALMAQFDQLSRASEESKKRIKEWEGELARVKGGGQLEALRKELDLGVLSNKEIAAAFTISEDAVKFYEKSLKSATDAQRDADQAAKRLREEQERLAREQEKLDKALEKMGVVTLRSVNTNLAEMATQVKIATAHGVPFEAVARAIWPELLKLAEQAKASGISVSGLKDAIDKYGAGVTIANKMTTNWIPLQKAATEANGEMVQGVQDHNLRLIKLTEAYHDFGLKSPAELRKVADEAKRNYELVAASGTLTTKQLKDAYKQMIDAQNAASGQLPSKWQTEVVPGIKNALVNLERAVDGSFAQMLIGAKGFKDGFVDIWNSLKATAVNILNEILSHFLKQFIGGLLGGMSGASGSFAQALGGMVAGGGGGGGFGGLGINAAQALMGGGGAGTTYGASALPGMGVTPAVGGNFTGFSGFTGAGATALGLGAVGGAGIGMGYLGKKFTGGAGWKAAGIGAAGGAATGALIGTFVFPGVGTAVGAGVGALAGFVSGKIGKSADRKADEKADQELADYREELLKTYGTLEKIDQIGKMVGVDLAGAWGDKSRAGLQNFGTLMNEFLKNHEQLQGAMERYGVSWEELGTTVKQSTVDEYTKTLIDDQKALETAGMSHEAVVRKQAAGFSELYQTILRTGTQASPALIPIFEELIDMGILVDETGAQVHDLGAVQFGALGEKGGTALVGLIQQLSNVAEGVENPSQAFTDLITQIQAGARDGTINLAQVSAAMRKLFESGEAPQEAVDVLNAGLRDLGNEGVSEFRDLSGSVDDLGQRLMNTPWQDWKNEAVAAAAEVEAAINHVNFGRSPGGLKEIPLLLAKSMEKFETFKAFAIKTFGQLEERILAAVHSMGMFNAGINFETYGDISPETQAQIDAIQKQIEALEKLRDKKDPGIGAAKDRLEADKERLSDLRDDTPEMIALKRRYEDLGEKTPELLRLEQRYEDLGQETDEMIALERKIREARGGERAKLERQMQKLVDARDDERRAIQQQIETIVDARESERRSIEATVRQQERSREDQARVLEAQIEAQERAIEAMEKSLELKQQEIDLQIETLQAQQQALQQIKNPLSGFPIVPTEITRDQAKTRVDEIFLAYGGRKANAAELKLIQALYGEGPIYKSRLDQLLLQMVQGYFNAQFPQYDVGTKRTHGSYFQDFRGGTPVMLHGDEAVLTKNDVPDFLRTFGGASDRELSVSLYVAMDREGNARVMDKEAWTLDVVQRGMTTGRLSVPKRIVSQRTG